MASSLSIPRDADNVPVGMGVWSSAGTPTAAWIRILDAAVLTTEETPSGAIAVGNKVLHDGADVAAVGPLKMGFYAKAAAPSDVSGDGDIVNGWALRNGAQVVNLSAAGALIPGDATNGLRTYITPPTSGGWDVFAATSQDGSTALTNSAQAVKASAGQVGGWIIFNPNDETSFVNFYNTASGSVTVGTTNPLFHWPVPAGAAANIVSAIGIPFGTAISISGTKTAGSNTAPDTAMEAVILYK